MKHRLKPIISLAGAGLALAAYAQTCLYEYTGQVCVFQDTFVGHTADGHDVYSATQWNTTYVSETPGGDGHQGTQRLYPPCVGYAYWVDSMGTRHYITNFSSNNGLTGTSPDPAYPCSGT